MANIPQLVAEDDMDAAGEATISRPPTPERLSTVDMAVCNALIVLNKQRVRLLNIMKEAKINDDPMRITWAKEALDAIETRQQV